MMMSGFSSFDTGFSMFSIMFTVVFVLVIGVFLVTIFKGIGTWHRNNNSPRLTVQATVIGKRDDVHRYHHHTGSDHMHHNHYSTTYYITFEVESGDRMEFQVSGEESGLLVEGDSGMLTFQGTRYLGFERT